MPATRQQYLPFPVTAVKIIEKLQHTVDKLSILCQDSPGIGSPAGHVVVPPAVFSNACSGSSVKQIGTWLLTTTERAVGSILVRHQCHFGSYSPKEDYLRVQRLCHGC